MKVWCGCCSLRLKCTWSQTSLGEQLQLLEEVLSSQTKKVLSQALSWWCRAEGGWVSEHTCTIPNSARVAQLQPREPTQVFRPHDLLGQGKLLFGLHGNLCRDLDLFAEWGIICIFKDQDVLSFLVIPPSKMFVRSTYYLSFSKSSFTTRLQMESQDHLPWSKGKNVKIKKYVPVYYLSGNIPARKKMFNKLEQEQCYSDRPQNFYK